jgi:vacuolar-type H+-ATPase subunit F/Vma7
MSRLLVVTHSALVPGFHLAGVEAFAADDEEAAQALIGTWLDAGENGLLVLESSLMAELDPRFRRRLDAAEHLPCLAIPGGEPYAAERSRRQIAELIRKAIGFHVTFRGESEA